DEYATGDSMERVLRPMAGDVSSSVIAKVSGRADVEPAHPSKVAMEIGPISSPSLMGLTGIDHFVGVRRQKVAAGCRRPSVLGLGGARLGRTQRRGRTHRPLIECADLFGKDLGQLVTFVLFKRSLGCAESRPRCGLSFRFEFPVGVVQTPVVG